MVTGKTEFTGTTKMSVIEASKEMHKNTMKQAKSMGKHFPIDIKGAYLPKVCKNFKNPTSEDMYSSSGIEPQITFEPKMDNRWYLKFPKEFNISEWHVESLTRPTYPFDIDSKISVVLRDTIEPSITENLMMWIENQKPFKLKIEILDPLSVVVEKWTLEECIITKIEWSPLDYGSNGISTIHVEIYYNKVKFKKK